MLRQLCFKWWEIYLILKNRHFTIWIMWQREHLTLNILPYPLYFISLEISLKLYIHRPSNPNVEFSLSLYIHCILQDIDWVQTEKHVFEVASNHPFLVGLHSCFQTPSRLVIAKTCWYIWLTQCRPNYLVLLNLIVMKGLVNLFCYFCIPFYASATDERRYCFPVVRPSSCLSVRCDGGGIQLTHMCQIPLLVYVYNHYYFNPFCTGISIYHQILLSIVSPLTGTFRH